MGADLICDFTVRADVLPKQADRSMIRKNRDGKPYVSHYAVPATRRNASDLGKLIAKYRPRVCVDHAPLGVTITVVREWRRSEPKKIREGFWMRRHATAPDADNLAKQVLDVLQRGRFFGDDSRVSDLIVMKRWGPENLLRVRIERLAPNAEPRLPVPDHEKVNGDG